MIRIPSTGLLAMVLMYFPTQIQCEGNCVQVHDGEADLSVPLHGLVFVSFLENHACQDHCVCRFSLKKKKTTSVILNVSEYLLCYVSVRYVLP